LLILMQVHVACSCSLDQRVLPMNAGASAIVQLHYYPKRGRGRLSSILKAVDRQKLAHLHRN
jgi:hypothetical protein